MILKVEKMEQLLESLGCSPCEFADKLDIEPKESYKLLSGERVGVHTARKFINFFKAEFSQECIDWKALENAPTKGELPDGQPINILQGQDLQNFCQA